MFHLLIFANNIILTIFVFKSDLFRKFFAQFINIIHILNVEQSLLLLVAVLRLYYGFLVALDWWVPDICFIDSQGILDEFLFVSSGCLHGGLLQIGLRLSLLKSFGATFEFGCGYFRQARMIIGPHDFAANTKTVVLLCGSWDIWAEIFDLAPRGVGFRLLKNVITMISHGPLVRSSDLLFLNPLKFEALIIHLLESEIERAALSVWSWRSANLSSMVISVPLFERRKQRIIVVTYFDQI